MAIRKLEKEPPQPFNVWLREARLDKGWTQDELARRAGCREKEIGRYENGQHLPQTDRLMAIMKALGHDLPFSWFVNEAPDLQVFVGGGELQGRVERHLVDAPGRKPTHGSTLPPRPPAPHASG